MPTPSPIHMEPEKRPLSIIIIFFVVSFSLLFSKSLSTHLNDTAALTLFRRQTDVHGALLSNWTGADACAANQTWRGVLCSGLHVTSLFLPSLSLRGPVNSLSFLSQLRILDLHDNRLNGSISPIANCSNLKLVYLSGNDFSSEIPSEISSLRQIRRLDLSHNNFCGEIPSSFSNFSHLLTLRLEDNALSGRIPDFLSSIRNLTELDLSKNQFYGRLPDGLLKKFGEKGFLGNEELCGPRILPACPPVGAPRAASLAHVPSSPSSLSPSQELRQDKERTKKELSHSAVIAMIIASCAALLMIVSFVIAYFCRKRLVKESSNLKAGSESGKRRGSYWSEKEVYTNASNYGGGGGDGILGSDDRSKLVFYDRRKQFELEDLLRASAEMMGKGSLGTVYKAVLDDGYTVAVKRLKDANPCGRKEFEQYMDVIGKLKHPNIVHFRAYYYAKEEKLLIYDFLPNGNLHYLLHGNRGQGRIPLDWTTRVSLVLGAAHGLARIHEEYSDSNIPHGNVKSSNVLLDKNGVACVSDFGLSLLLSPAHATANLGGYRAPEQAKVKRLSQKADIYSFGVLLLEVLTGKSPFQYPSQKEDEEEEEVDLPKWVRSVVKDEWTAEVFDRELLKYKNIEEELVEMLHVALACVGPQPEQRPSMSEVAQMIEDIRVEQSPLVEELDESRNSLSFSCHY